MGALAWLVLWSLVAWLLFAQHRAARAFRSLAPLLAATAAIAAFGAAPLLTGGYSADVALFIGGPNAYRVETVERSFAGLAVGIGLLLLAAAAVGRWLAPKLAARALDRALALTLAVVVLRIALEKLGVPLGVVTAIGIIWLVPAVGVYLAVDAARSGRATRFWKGLTFYTVTVRLFVIAVMLAATHFELGTHFDNSRVTRFEVLGETHEVDAHSWEQYWSLIFFPQLFLWSGLTLLGGALAGAPVYALARRRNRGQAVDP